jgi:hypothetical protein
VRRIGGCLQAFSAGPHEFCAERFRSVGDDAQLASKEAARLAQERKQTRDALLAHLRQEHADLVGKATLFTSLPV